VRIVHVANFYRPGSGGLRTTMHALGRGYRAAGHESVMVVAGERAAVEQTPAGLRYTLAGMPLPRSGGYRMITDVDRVCALLDRLAPDRLEVSDRFSLRGLGWWAAQAGVPSMGFAHERLDGVLEAFGPRRLPGRGRAARLLADLHNRGTAARFDRIVCTSEFAAAEFRRIGAGPLEHVPLGVDLETFTPHRARAQVRQALAADGSPLLVLCSRLSAEKRPDLAVDALRELHRRGVPATLAIAGSGPLLERVRRSCGDLPVHVLGHLGERGRLAALLASADVVLAPGPIETFGLAALEALACGTPVVCARTSALAELVTGDAGRAADVDGVAMADAVLDVLARPQQQRRAAARERAQEFPWSRTTATLLRLHGADAPAAPEAAPLVPALAVASPDTAR
jgi:alpha-1,6-mannosyltransferase